MVHIINQLNESNSSNHKLEVLKQHQDNKLLQRVLKMAIDTVAFTYGISLKRIPSTLTHNPTCSLSDALDVLEQKFATREWTGNHAIDMITRLLESLTPDDAAVLLRVIDRDLRINCGTTQINKVFKGLIVDPPYMRCGVYSEKTAAKVKFPAILQLKADGTFRNVIKDGDSVRFISRSGEESFFDNLSTAFSFLKDGVYIGELLVKGIADRAEANGLINSDNIPQDDVYMQVWDYLTPDEWKAGKSNVPYHQRLKTVSQEIGINMFNSNCDNIELIPTFIVNSIQEALQKTSEFMNDGFEGAVLKDMNTLFKDHTSPTQLKLKLEIEISVRITGFTPGKNKNAAYFGAIMFETDDGQIKGQVGVSSMPEKTRNYIHEHRDEMIFKIMDVQFNDLTKGRDNDYYALSHPRFLLVRDDITKTDTLERAFELREMAMQLGGK